MGSNDDGDAAHFLSLGSDHAEFQVTAYVTDVILGVIYFDSHRVGFKQLRTP